MSDDDKTAHDLTLEYRRMAAAMTVGQDLKHVHLNVAHRDPVYPVRDRIENMRRADLEDAYAMLLELVVLHPETLGPYAVPEHNHGG